MLLWEYGLPKQCTLMKRLHEPLQTPSPSTQVPQASKEDVPGGINRLGRCRKVEHHFSGDVESSRDMRT